MDTLRVGFELDTKGAVAAVARVGSATATAEQATKKFKDTFKEGVLGGVLAVETLRSKTLKMASDVGASLKANGAWGTYKRGVDSVTTALGNAAGRAKRFFSEMQVGQKLKDGAAFWAGFYGMQALTGAIGGAIDVYKELKTESRTLAAAFGLSGKDAESFATQLKLLKAESGLTSEQLTLGFQQLASAGLKARDSSLILAATADVQARVGDAAAESFKKTAANIAKVGVTPEAISGLREAGFTLDEMAKALNLKGNIKTFQQLNMAVATTKTTSKEALNGMLALVSTKFDKGGLLGGAAKELADQSLEKQLDNLKRAFGDLFTKIDLSPITNAMVALREQLNGDLGDKLRVAITQIGNVAVQLVPVLINAVSFFAKIAASPITKWVVMFVGVLVGVTKVAAAVSALSSAFGVLFGVVGSVVTVVASIGLWPIVIGAALIAVGVVIYKNWDTIKAFFVRIGPALFETMKTIGAFLLDGLTFGMGTKIASVVEKVTGIGSTIKNTFKSVMGIKSPSTVMAAEGIHLPGGVAKGINSGVGLVESAAANMATAARDGYADSATVPASPAVSASSLPGTTTNNITISVQVDGAGHDGESLGDALEQRLRDVARQLFGEVTALRGSYA